MAIYQSSKESLRVTFPPEMTINGAPIGFGMDVYGKPAPFPPAKFTGHQFETQKEILVNCLDNHTGNQANGGAEFWKIPDDILMLDAMSGEVIIHNLPDSLSKEQKEVLDYLDKAASKVMPTQIDKLCVMYEQVVSDYKITGVKPLTHDLKIRLIKARLVELLTAFEDAGVLDA